VCDQRADTIDTLDATVDAPSAARVLVARAAGHAHVDAEQREVAILLTSETVTNVVRHTDSATVSISISCDGSDLTVSVGDSDPSPLRTYDPSDSAESGRGLVLVRRLAASWGVDTTPRGKQVWFRPAH
jgi:anti-sigma regulatory factor (Ser/Thr protein kinase)